MSAIACKIIICSQKSQAVSSMSTFVVQDLAKNLKLSRKVLKTQEKYIEDMEALLQPLTEEENEQA